MNTLKTIISLGPSLSLAEAQVIYPDGLYHTPFQCGDLITLLRLKPERIAVIDGRFEDVAAVWHKEILWALSQGIEVFGASSMGALRAAEMKNFGMQPVGVIADYYAEGHTEDDDVALTYDSRSNTGSLTLVDLRATLSVLQAQGWVDANEAEQIFHRAKQIPYFQRTLERLGLSPALTTLLHTYEVNQKKEDAITLLKRLQANIPCPVQPIAMVPSLYFRQLYQEYWHAPFRDAYAWLPAHEREYASYSKAQQTLITQYGKMLDLLAGSFPSPSFNEILKSCVPSTSISLIQKHLSIYYQARFPSHTIPATWLTEFALLWDSVMTYLGEQRCILRPQAIQAFANEWRRKLTLHTVQQTRQWQESTGLLTAEDYTQCMMQLAYLDCFVERNNGAALLKQVPVRNHSWLPEILMHLQRQ
jgi:hypothetical protein